MLFRPKKAAVIEELICNTKLRWSVDKGTVHHSVLSAHRYPAGNRNEPNDKWILRAFRDNLWRFFETSARRLPLTSPGILIIFRE